MHIKKKRFYGNTLEDQSVTNSLTILLKRETANGTGAEGVRVETESNIIKAFSRKKFHLKTSRSHEVKHTGP